MRKFVSLLIAVVCVAAAMFMATNAQEDPLDVNYTSGGQNQPKWCEHVGAEFNSVSVIGKTDKDGDGYYEAFDLVFEFETEIGCTKMVKVRANPPGKESGIFGVRGIKGGPYSMSFEASEFSNLGSRKIVTIFLDLLSADGKVRYDRTFVNVKIDGYVSSAATPTPTPTPTPAPNPNATWAKIYSKAGDQEAKKMLKTDNGLVVLAVTGNVTNSSNKDLLIFKINWQGEVLWSKNYGTAANETPVSIIETNDGYVVLATTDYDGRDIYIVKMDKNGNVLERGVTNLS